MMVHLIDAETCVPAYTKLYTKRLFENGRYPKGKISEDAYIIMDILSQVNKAVFTPRTEYYYLHRGDSINTARYREIDSTRIEAHKKNYEYIKKEYPEFTQLAYERYLGAVYFVAHKMVMSDYDGLSTKKLTTELKNDAQIIISSKYFTVKRKFIIIMMITNMGLYKQTIKRLKL